MNSLRLEKGIPLFGKDFTKDHSVLEVFGTDNKFIQLDEKQDFAGRDVLVKQKETGMLYNARGGFYGAEGGRLRFLKSYMISDDGLDTDPVGNEPIYLKGTDKCVGFTTSGSYGFNVCKSVGMAYGYDYRCPVLRSQGIEFQSQADLDNADMEVDILGKRRPFVWLEKPLFAAAGARDKMAKAAAAGGDGGVKQRA